MNWWILAGITLLVVVMFGLYLSNTAGRLDQLNRRIDRSRHSLDAHLLRRSSVVTELAGSGMLDPSSSMLLAEAAREARIASESEDLDRAEKESDLTEVLAAVFAETDDVEALRELPGGVEMADEIDGVARRVTMSRRFLNDGVRATRVMMDRRLVRWFKLAGRTPRPDTFEMLDTPPAGFGVR